MPTPALAEYLKREKVKKDKRKTPDRRNLLGQMRRQDKEKEDFSYLGRLTRLNMPRGGG